MLYQTELAADSSYTATTEFFISTCICFTSWVILSGFPIYFVRNEIKQVFLDPIDYLSSFWNYLDLLGPLGIFTLFLMVIFNADKAIF